MGVTPKSFSVQVNWVSWKRSVRAKLVAFYLCCKLKQEANHLALCSRKCRIKNLHCIACNVLFVITELAKPGYGGHCGCLSNLILNVPNLLNTKQNTRKRSQSPRPTSTKPLLSAAKNEYVLALQSGGSAVQEIIDKTNRIEAMK